MTWTAPKDGWYELTWLYEISPREREDEARRDEHDFGTQEFEDQEQLVERRLGEHEE